MLKFDEKTTKLLEIAYQGADVSRRRRATFDALQPRAGERILDIGCGNGLLTIELARAVGDAGLIVGIDPSPSMLEPATKRCQGYSNVRFLDGTANSLPLENDSIDKAASLQVFEYLNDIPGAIKEAHRVIRKGGRFVIGDAHWDSLIWHSHQKSRMNKVVDAWDHHLVEGRVPAILPNLLSRGGFVVEKVEPLTICDTDLRPDGLANMLIHLMQPYAVENGYCSEEEAQSWADEQMALAKNRGFFFSLTYFVVIASKL